MLFSATNLKGEQILVDSITINFHGDIHISISPDSANRLMQSVSKPANDGTAVSEDMTASEGYQALVQSIEDFLNDTADEYGQYEDGAEDEDIDSIVVVICPGEAPRVMTESECYEAVEQHGEFGAVLTVNAPDICAYGLKAAYDPRTVLKLGKERYLVGPVIVYGSDFDGDSISLDAEEVMAAIVYFADHTVTLCADGHDIPAFIL